MLERRVSQCLSEINLGKLNLTHLNMFDNSWLTRFLKHYPRHIYFSGRGEFFESSIELVNKKGPTYLVATGFAIYKL